MENMHTDVKAERVKSTLARFISLMVIVSPTENGCDSMATTLKRKQKISENLKRRNLWVLSLKNLALSQLTKII